MNAQHVNTCMSSVRRVFGTMMKLEVRAGKPIPSNDTYAAADVSAIIGFSGDAAGCVVLGFPRDVACAVASRFAGVEIDTDHPDFADALGELANMVAGSAKAEFEGMDVSISLPSVIVGEEHTVALSRLTPRIVIPYESELGAIFVEIGMETKEACTTFNLAAAGVD